jgi:phospholipid/cholesterol/gamma-HCH transport system ATP-binding protein
MTPAISCRGVRVSFGSREVLKGIDLDVAPGELLVIMGSSGGGKTTLLKCMSGLMIPAEGGVKVKGSDTRREPEAVRGRIGMVFQFAALFDSLTVEENILFGVRRRRRLSRAERRAIVERRLAEVGLQGAEKRLPSELSGGMRKRVGLARALASEPEILLYDEPTSGLDPVTAYAIDRLIEDTRARSGAASVVVSHDVSSVLRIADRVCFLHQGEAIFIGSRDDFRAAEAGPIRELVDKARAESFLEGDR